MPYIELDNQTANNLTAQAKSRGLTVAEYLSRLVPPAPNGHGDAPFADELDAELDELVLDLPTLPADFSRADIYDEHD